jgi:hypothetical protein
MSGRCCAFSKRTVQRPRDVGHCRSRLPVVQDRTRRPNIISSPAHIQQHAEEQQPYIRSVKNRDATHSERRQSSSKTHVQIVHFVLTFSFPKIRGPAKWYLRAIKSIQSTRQVGAHPILKLQGNMADRKQVYAMKPPRVAFGIRVCYRGNAGAKDRRRVVCCAKGNAGMVQGRCSNASLALVGEWVGVCIGVDCVWYGVVWCSVCV